jgi:virginiamycin B lyase
MVFSVLWLVSLNKKRNAMRQRRFLFLTLFLLLAPLMSACGGPTTPSSTAASQFQEYALPQNESGLMRPTIDAQGRLWFGEMSRNLLGSFDPHTGKFWQETPPDGKSGIMGIVAAPDGTIWFAEQYADYIGHYFPQSGHYQIYPLPTLKVPESESSTKITSLPSAPNDVVLDTHGILWFTEINANAIGSLNTFTGVMHQYPLTRTKQARDLDPYGITIDLQGNIWFTDATTNQLGRLNPANGQVNYFTPPGVTATLMEVTSDSHDQIWATTFEQGLLIRFNPTSDQFKIYRLPTTGSLYGVAVATNGDIWVTVTANNLLGRLDTKTQRFSYYHIPTPGSQPIGLVEGPNQSIWFTEGWTNKLGVVHPSPQP